MPTYFVSYNFNFTNGYNIPIKTGSGCTIINTAHKISSMNDLFMIIDEIKKRPSQEGELDLSGANIALINVTKL